MAKHSTYNWAHDLVFPTILFAALGGMTWAVRGCSGYGASAGCIFAGVTLGAAWWFIAREPAGAPRRRYASGWIILAMTVAFGVAGCRGWMQWPSFFNNVLQVNYDTGETVPIARAYGFVWLFIAGVPWAGLGACAVAWCASHSRTTAWQWIIRLACGIGMAYLLSVVLYERFPNVFLPLYDSLKDKYQDLATNRSLWKLVRDNREAMIQLGLYLGFLLFEVARRDWRNVTLILTVGLVNGAGWALLQNWMWANRLWPDAHFNFWRAWETSGGISIGIAYGVAYFLVNRPMAKPDSPAQPVPPSASWLVAFLVTAALIGLISPEVMPVWCSAALTLVAMAFALACYLAARQGNGAKASAFAARGQNLERWGACLGLILGLGLSVKNGLKGWANIYLGNEGYWDAIFMNIVGPLMILALAAISAWIFFRPRLPSAEAEAFPHAYAIIWLVLIVQNTLAQMITGPLSNWSEMAFKIYYVLLFLLTAAIIHHYHCLQAGGPRE